MTKYEKIKEMDFMPLVTSKEMFEKAYKGGYAIGAFNVNNMEIIQGITEAAKELNAPLILQVSAKPSVVRTLQRSVILRFRSTPVQEIMQNPKASRSSTHRA